MSAKYGIKTVTNLATAEELPVAARPARRSKRRAACSVVIDLANSPSFEDKAVLESFRNSGSKLLAVEAAVDVQHHVALSIVGTNRTPDNGYFRAKVANEKLVEAAGASPAPSSARPGSRNSFAASPLQVRMKTESGFRPAWRRTTLL